MTKKKSLPRSAKGWYRFPNFDTYPSEDEEIRASAETTQRIWEAMVRSKVSRRALARRMKMDWAAIAGFLGGHENQTVELLARAAYHMGFSLDLRFGPRTTKVRSDRKLGAGVSPELFGQVKIPKRLRARLRREMRER